MQSKVQNLKTSAYLSLFTECIEAQAPQVTLVTFMMSLSHFFTRIPSIKGDSLIV